MLVRHRTATLALALLVLGLEPARPAPQAPAGAVAPPLQQMAADSLLGVASLASAVRADLAAGRVPGAAVAVVLGDQVVFAKGFGVASAETGLPVNTGTLFQIGSMTKVLTATALVGLAEEGKLDLDAPIGTYVQGLAPTIAAVTAGQLLSQTAGLKDRPGADGLHEEAALAAAARSLKDDARPLAPGRVFSYSNQGFALAGLLLQEISGKPYAEAMAERVFSPLGMSRTTFRPTVAMTYPLAVGHQVREDKQAVVRPMDDDTRLWPAGYAYSCLDDLIPFARAFLNGGRLGDRQVLSPAVIARMSMARAEIPALFDHGRYGYGLFLLRDHGVEVLEHPGTTTGFSALIRFEPTKRLALIVLANGDGVRFPRTTEAAMKLVPGASAAEIKSELRPEIQMTAAEMARYAGAYENRWRIELVDRDGKLWLVRPGGQELPVAKIGKDRFQVRPEGGPPQEFVLGLGPDGRPDYLHMFLWAFPRIAG